MDARARRRHELPGTDDPPLPEPVAPLHVEHGPSRNDPCPCGSGREAKACCGAGHREQTP